MRQPSARRYNTARFPLMVKVSVPYKGNQKA